MNHPNQFSITETSNSSSQIVTVVDTQALLFGNLLSTLFDQIHQIMDRILREGILTLPFLSYDNDTSKTEKDAITANPNMKTKKDHERMSLLSYSSNDRRAQLFQMIHSAYTENMDMAELYAARNIFTLDGVLSSKYTKRQKSEIVERYWKALHKYQTTTKNHFGGTDQGLSEINNSDTGSYTSLDHSYSVATATSQHQAGIDAVSSPSISSSSSLTARTDVPYFSSILSHLNHSHHHHPRKIPSSTEHNELDQKLDLVRRQVRDALIRRNLLRSHSSIIINNSKTRLDNLEYLLTSSSVSIYDMTSAVIMGKEVLEESIDQAKNTIDALTERRKQLNYGEDKISHENGAEALCGEETVEFGKAMKFAASQACLQATLEQNRQKAKIHDLSLDIEYTEKKLLYGRLMEKKIFNSFTINN